jgi:hypothetical protein
MARQLAEATALLRIVPKAGLPGISDQKALLFRQFVHSRSGGEVVGRLLAAVQHHDQRERFSAITDSPEASEGSDRKPMRTVFRGTRLIDTVPTRSGFSQWTAPGDAHKQTVSALMVGLGQSYMSEALRGFLERLRDARLQPGFGWDGRRSRTGRKDIFAGERPLRGAYLCE